MSFQDDLRAAAKSARDGKSARQKAIEAAKTKWRAIVGETLTPAMRDVGVVLRELDIYSSSNPTKEGIDLVVGKDAFMKPQDKLSFRLNPCRLLVICESSEGRLEESDIDRFTADIALEKVREFFREIVEKYI